MGGMGSRPGQHECTQKEIKNYIYIFELFALISSGFCIAHLHVKSMMSCCRVGSGRMGVLCFINVCLLLRVSHRVCGRRGAGHRFTYCGDSSNST